MITNTPIVPGSRVVIEGTTYNFVSSEKRGRWDYIIVTDKKGKRHEFTAGKVEEILAPEPTISKPTPEPNKEAPVSNPTPDTPKAEKSKPVPPAPRQKTPFEQMTPLNQGFERYRQLHPAALNEALGRKVQGNGDNVDELMRTELAENGDDIWSCPSVIKHLDVPTLKAKYAHLNKGMVRMNIGNKLRGVLNNADENAAKAEKAAAKKAEQDRKKAEREAARKEAAEKKQAAAVEKQKAQEAAKAAKAEKKEAVKTEA